MDGAAVLALTGALAAARVATSLAISTDFFTPTAVAAPSAASPATRPMFCITAGDMPPTAAFARPSVTTCA